MKPIVFLLAGAAALATAACGGENNAAGGSGGDSASSGPVTEAPRPANGDWSQAVVATHEGGFLMGNPNAEVKLVEFGSMTCPHCAEFDETGLPKLIDTYVKDGRVSFEFRNYVRDPYDIAASLIARCNGAQSFFPLTNGLFKDQAEWIAKLQAVPPEQQQTLQTMGPEQQFKTVAEWAGFQSWAAMRGVPTAKSTQCLADQDEVNRLVQMNSDATEGYNVPGTPAFLINNKLVEGASSWERLEPEIKKALD